MDQFAVDQPKDLDYESWKAIDSYRARAADAAARDDRPAVIGGCKELAECVARVVLTATGTTLSDKADFSELISTAQAVVGMHPPALVSQPQARVIAQNASKIVKLVSDIRNDVGTGHGRARAPEIDSTTVLAVTDATMLWVRWILRVLETILRTTASALIGAVNTAIGQTELQKRMDEIDLPHQAPAEQHAIGVAFGQQAAGGFGNAWIVGVDPVVRDVRLDRWPAAYRLGLIEGFLINWEGRIGMVRHPAEALAPILKPVPEDDAVKALRVLIGRVRQSSWITDWRGNSVDPLDTVAAMQNTAGVVPLAVEQELVELRTALAEPVIGF